MSSAAPSESPPFPIGTRELVAMLALAQSLQALAIDFMLPGLGLIANDLGAADPNRRQLVVGLFLVGIGLGSLIPGTLADRFGRRPVLLGCIAGFVAISFACALVQDFTVLAALRLIEGFICAGLAVIPLAVIRDRFDGDRMASLQSLMAVIFLVIPMLAPSAGQLVLLVAGWRWIFALMGVLGVVMGLWVGLRLPETLNPDYRQSLGLRTIATNMAEVVRTRASIGYVFANCCTLAVIWAYVQSCQQLVGEHFGAGTSFPLFFGGMAMCMACASFTNSRIVGRFGARRVAHSALMVYLVVAVVQFAWAHSGRQTLWPFVILMTLTMICGAFSSANFSSIALQPFARTAGAASSVQGFLRNSLAALMAAGIGQAYDGTARPLSDAILGAGLAALALILWSERGRLFRRLNPPQAPAPGR